MEGEDLYNDNYSIAKKPAHEGGTRKEAPITPLDSFHSNISKKSYNSSRPSPPRSLPPNTNPRQHAPQLNFSSQNHPSFSTGSNNNNTQHLPHSYQGNTSRYPDKPAQNFGMHQNWHGSADSNNTNGHFRGLDQEQKSHGRPAHLAMDIETYNPNIMQLFNKTNTEANSNNREPAMELESLELIQKEKSSTETPKNKILDPRLRGEQSDGKRDSTKSRDKHYDEETDKIEKILKKVKKLDSSKTDLKRALSTGEFDAIIQSIDVSKGELESKYTNFSKVVSMMASQSKKAGGEASEKFKINYFIMQALMNTHSESARGVVQELTEEILDLSLENIIRQKNCTVSTVKNEEHHDAVDGENAVPKVLTVPHSEIYKYDENLKEMEEKMEKLEYIIGDKKSKLNQLDRRIAKSEIDMQKNRIKHELLLRLNQKLA